MSKKDRQFWESAMMNNATYQDYYDRLVELSMAMFEWKDAPAEMNVRYLELELFKRGGVAFFKDEALGYLTLPFTHQNVLNVYNEPTDIHVFANNGYNNDLNKNNSVIIWNNLLHKPSCRTIEMYAKRLYNYDRIIDVNSNAQKTPVLITCDESQRMTLINLYRQWSGNEPVIYGTKNLDISGLKSLKTDAPYICDKIMQLKTQQWNEALTYLGISNISVQKKERMVSDEVTRMMGGTIASRYSRLESRRTACEAINKMFGLNISVDFRDDFREADDEIMFTGDTGDDEAVTMATDIRTR